MYNSVVDGRGVVQLDKKGEAHPSGTSFQRCERREKSRDGLSAAKAKISPLYRDTIVGVTSDRFLGTKTARGGNVGID